MLHLKQSQPRVTNCDTMYYYQILNDKILNADFRGFSRIG